MLNINIHKDTPAEIREMLTDMRRSHVSKFPIDVTSHVNDIRVVIFSDSRFPMPSRPNRTSVLGYLEGTQSDSRGNRVYKLTSRLIRNEKYAAHNDDYYSKHTTDIKKMAKFVREYIKPWSSYEIMDKTANRVDSDHTMWQTQPRDEFSAMVGAIRNAEIAEELLYLHSVGVQFRSDRFRRIVADGLPLYEEAKRRVSVTYKTAHVYLQPDNSVLVTLRNGSEKTSETYTYQTLEEAPVAVAQAVAMLRMCEVDQFVPEMGRMINESLFWVLVPADTFKSDNT